MSSDHSLCYTLEEWGWKDVHQTREALTHMACIQVHFGKCRMNTRDCESCMCRNCHFPAVHSFYWVHVLVQRTVRTVLSWFIMTVWFSEPHGFSCRKHELITCLSSERERDWGRGGLLVIHGLLSLSQLSIVCVFCVSTRVCSVQWGVEGGVGGSWLQFNIPVLWLL